MASALQTANQSANAVIGKKKKDPNAGLQSIQNPFQQQTTPVTPASQAGSYDALKGGYTSPGGQLYPTNNPNFVPNPNSINVKNNPDGSVNYGGIKMSAKDYFSLTNQGDAQAVMTPAVQEAMKLTSNPQVLQGQAAIGQIGQTTPIQGGNVGSLGQNVLGAAPEIGSNIIAGAAIGAAAGSILPGAGTIAGGVAGAVAGLGKSMASLMSEERQNTLTQKTDFIASKKSINDIISAVNKGAIDPLTAVSLYNQELAKIDLQERNLKALEETNWLSKARPQLARIQSFNDNERQLTAQLLQQAILKPNPAAIGLIDIEAADTGVTLE